MSSSSSDWWRKGFEANLTTIESLIKEELDIDANNYVYCLQLFISLITFLKSKTRNNNLDNNKSLILPTESIKVNKSAKKNEDKASEVPLGTLTSWNAGISSTTNSLASNDVNSDASYSSAKPNVDEEGRKMVNFSGLSKKRAHKEVGIPFDYENLLFSVTNPIADHALLATPTNLANEPAKKKKDEATEIAKKKKEEARELAMKKKEEARELAKKKKEEADELAKKKKEEANELAKKKKEEANELAKKKKEEANELAKRKEEANELAKKKKEEAIELEKKMKEEAIELAKKKEEAIELAKKKEEAIKLAKKKKEEAIELAKKKKEEANELAKKKKEEANELAKKKKEEAIELAKKKKEEANELAKKKKEAAIELARKKKEEAIELAKKRKEEATELAKKKKEEATELAKKKKEAANELAKKKKDEAIASSTKPKVNIEGRKLDNLVRPFSKKRAHKEASSTNAAQFDNIPGMSGLASPYYSNVGDITSSLAVKGVINVVDDSATKCPKEISGTSSDIVTHGDSTSLYAGISRKINSLFGNYADLEPIADPLSSKQPLLEISSSPWNDEKLLSSSSSTNVTDPKNLGSMASLQEVIPYVSIEELDTYEDSKTLNFSQNLIQWSDEKVNSGALEVWTREHDKSLEGKPVWDLVEEEPVPVSVYTGDDIKYIEDKHVMEPVPLQVYAGDKTKCFNEEHVWDLVENEPNFDSLNSVHHPRKRAKRGASRSPSDAQTGSVVTPITLE